MLTAKSCIRCSLTLLVTNSTSSEASGVSLTPARAATSFSRARWAWHGMTSQTDGKARWGGRSGLNNAQDVSPTWHYARGPVGIVENVIAFASTAVDMH